MALTNLKKILDVAITLHVCGYAYDYGLSFFTFRNWIMTLHWLGSGSTGKYQHSVLGVPSGCALGSSLNLMLLFSCSPLLSSRCRCVNVQVCECWFTRDLLKYNQSSKQVLCLFYLTYEVLMHGAKKVSYARCQKGVACTVLKRCCMHGAKKVLQARCQQGVAWMVPKKVSHT